MDMAHTQPGEITRRGEVICESHLRALVEPEHHGKYIVIDVDSGSYQIDSDHLAASDRAAAMYPGGRLFAMRIGYRALGRVGGGSGVVRR
jgi:hypothetical protein